MHTLPTSLPSPGEMPVPFDLNDPDRYPSPLQPALRRAAFVSTLQALYQALDEQLAEVDWQLDVERLTLFSQALRLRGHPERESGPLWSLELLPEAWRGAAERNPDAWHTWCGAVLSIEPWLRQPEDVATVARRVHERARREAAQNPALRPV